MTPGSDAPGSKRWINAIGVKKTKSTLALTTAEASASGSKISGQLSMKVIKTASCSLAEMASADAPVYCPIASACSWLAPEANAFAAWLALFSELLG